MMWQYKDFLKKHFNQNFVELKLFWTHIAIIFLGFQVCRIMFYLFNFNIFQEVSWQNFIGGMRFDLSVIGYVNIIFALFYLFPFQSKSTNSKFLFRMIFFIVNMTILSLNFIDFEYFKFTGKRSTFSMITATGMSDSIGALIISFLQEFWYILVLFIITSVVLWKLLPKTNSYIISPLKYRIASLLFTISLLFIMGRGGLQPKPIRIVDAVCYGEVGNTALILNTPFSVLKTIGKKEDLKEMSYFTEEESYQYFNPISKKTEHQESNKKNVVLIILESFGMENINIGQTPFLDDLIKKSLFFENGFANGKLSIDAVPSTVSGIPSLMLNSLITTSYVFNETNSLPKILKEQGFHTSFFHGAFNGSLNLEDYCKSIGFEKYYGMNQYNGVAAFDGKWGIFDEEFLQFFCNEISTFKEPFFTSIFTISSHNPYIIPERYKGKFPLGTTKIHESIAYTDYALKRFFETASKMPWFEETLFVITADHTSSEVTHEKYNNTVGKYRIPILFYAPSDKNLKGVSSKNMQQIDILPSVLDYLKINSHLVSFGKSYFDQANHVVFFHDNVYHLILDDYYLSFDGEKVLGLYHLKNDVHLKNNLQNKDIKNRKKLEYFIKSYVQSFNHRMIHNQMMVP